MGRSELSMLSFDISNGSSLMKALAVWPTEWVRHNSRSRANSRLPSEWRATRSRRAPSKLVGKFPWRKAEAQGTAEDFSTGWFVSCDKQTRRERVEAVGGGSCVDDHPFPAARRILLPLLPEICDSTILLSDALRHGASTGWSVCCDRLELVRNR